MISKPDKTDKEDACQNAQDNSAGFCFAGQCKPVGNPESKQNAHNKCADIQNKKISSQKTCIGIEKNRDEGGSGQNSETEGRNDAGILFSQAADHEKGI